MTFYETKPEKGCILCKILCVHNPVSNRYIELLYCATVNTDLNL